ncbi:RNA-directed DNA polymerase, eukaryota, reverse transcriptase zinc-binding domain protein [Tanacetum coccineum]
MAEEGGENVYDIGYGFGNPCRYLQEVFKGFLKCLGFENQDDDGGGVRGGDMDDPPPTSTSDDPSTMDDPTDQPIPSTGIVQRRAPPRPPISSGGMIKEKSENDHGTGILIRPPKKRLYFPGDTWKWLLEDDGRFTVKSLSRIADSKFLHKEEADEETLWNKCVPKKVNIFIWRALRRRLPVRCELDTRGIDLESLLCLL